VHSALTAIAIWAGPETYVEDIAADASPDAQMPARLTPARA